jgi:hypothetical protein
VNAEERQIECVISTEKDLEELVRQALVSGVLDLENCQIKVEFNLAEILKSILPLEALVSNGNINALFPTLKIDCPFEIKAKNTTFHKQVSMSTPHQIQPTGVSLCLKKRCDFRKAHFEEMTDFSLVEFDMDISEDESHKDACLYGFRFSEFKKNVRFSNICTKWNIDFDNVVFHGGADFHNATFKSTITFSWTTFKSEARFRYIRSHCQFFLKGNTLHNRLEIMPRSFPIDNQQFNLGISIEDSLFVKEESRIIVDCKFLKLDTSINSIDPNLIRLSEITMYQDRNCLTILNLKKDSNVKVHLQDCEFYGKNVAFTNVAMQQVSITGGNYVSGMAFYHCKWAKERPYFEFFKYPHTLFDMLEFRAMSFKERPSTEELMLIYAHLKTQAVEGGDMQLSNDFHFWQQFYQGQFQENQGFSWSNFYLYTSAYGVSAKLPLTWFIVVFIWFTYIYGASFQQPIENNFFNGFLTSLSASIPFVFNDVDIIKKAIGSITETKNLWFYPLYILQHLIQGYLLFQIGAAIRNKVKR